MEKIKVLLSVIRTITTISQDISADEEGNFDANKFESLSANLKQVICEISLLCTTVFYAFSDDSKDLLSEEEKEMIKKTYQETFSKLDLKKMLSHYSATTTTDFFKIKEFIKDEKVH
jgi:hypothetical protein